MDFLLLTVTDLTASSIVYFSIVVIGDFNSGKWDLESVGSLPNLNIIWLNMFCWLVVYWRCCFNLCCNFGIGVSSIPDIILSTAAFSADYALFKNFKIFRINIILGHTSIANNHLI